MTRSAKPTNHIIIRASTTSGSDVVDFAIIALTDSLRTALRQRLAIAAQFSADDNFHLLNYWCSDLGYYCNSESLLYTEKIIQMGQDWAFINFNPGEEQNLVLPKNHLEGHQMMINKLGYASFKAFSISSQEEYLTECFPISEVLQLKTN